MRSISYILLFVAAVLGIIALVLFIKNEDEKRAVRLTVLEKARAEKAKKAKERLKENDNELIEDLEKEFETLDNSKNASTKEKEQ